MDLHEVRQRAEEAQQLKDDPGFTAAVLALRKQWFGELMNATHQDQIVRLTNRLQALEAIPQQLQVHINDYTMAKARSK